VCGQVPPEVIKQLVVACKTGMYAQVQQQVSPGPYSAGPFGTGCGEPVEQPLLHGFKPCLDLHCVK
jgi:hypothetical protein